MRISLRMVLVALVALVAAGSLISVIPSESSSLSNANFSVGQCEEGRGVSLVVDFGKSSKREPLQFCAKDFEGTGWEILAATGLNAEGTSEYPTGFVCRLDNWPTVERQPCSKTPTAAQGSWAYFVASDQQYWRFSGQGAAMRKPACGSAEGWSFVETPSVASQSWPAILPKTFSCK